MYELTIRDRLREGIFGALIGAAAAYTFYRSLILFLILVPGAFIFFPVMRRRSLREKCRWELRMQFKEAIWIMNGYLSAGISVENAFEMTVPELARLYGNDSMIAEEFRKVVRGFKLNKPVEQLLNDFAVRSGIEDIQSFAEVFSIAKRNGGSLGSIIERTCRIIRDETEVAQEIRNMTAAKRYEQRIMNLLPFGIIIYINLSSGGFMDIMYETLTGRLVMTVCLMLTALSYYLSQRILDIRM